MQDLYDHIIDTMNEQEIKLGFREETLRLYYPKESLCHMLGIVEVSSQKEKEQLKRQLNMFKESVKDTLGKLSITRKEDRFCIKIEPEGVRYVHEQKKDDSFLREFIQMILTHTKDVPKLYKVFLSYNSNAICNKVSHGEFDFVIYFPDGVPDAYRYCIKVEKSHCTYHRFTLFDYLSFGFDEL